MYKERKVSRLPFVQSSPQKFPPKLLPLLLLLLAEEAKAAGAKRSAMAGSSEPTRVMVAVNESSIKGYPHPSISCRAAFDWMLSKLVRSNAAGFHLLFLHVQVPDEDGTRRPLSHCSRGNPPTHHRPWGGGLLLLCCCCVFEVLDGMPRF